MLSLSAEALQRGYVYLRKSRLKAERADPDVLRRHRSELLRLAEADGVTLAADRVFEEVGSGERIAQRPAFRRLLDCWRRLPARAGGVVYVMDVDRLSRGILTERGEVQGLLLRAHLLLRTPAGVTDLHKPAENLLYEIRGSLARHELLIYKQRAAAARAEMLRKGQLRIGRVPRIGYRWSRDKQKPVPSETFPILQALCRDALILSWKRLAEKYCLPASTIGAVLSNPMICGWPAQRFRMDDHGEPYLLPREEWLWPEQPGDYAAACTRADWEHIQAVMHDRWTKRGKTVGANGWCRDVVRFAGFEHLTCSLSARDHIETYALKPPGLPLLYIARAEVNAHVSNALLTRLRDREALSRSIAAYRASRQGEEPQNTPMLAVGALRLEAARREDELARLLRRELTADAADAESIRRVREEIRKELTTVRAQLNAATGAVPAIPAMDALLVDLSAYEPGQWLELWQEDLDDEARRAIVNALIERVPVRVEGAKLKHKRRTIGPVQWHPWLKLTK